MVDTSKIINALQPGGSYTVQVRSTNGSGESSEWSDAYTFSTPVNVLSTTNSTVAQYLSGSIAGIYSSSNLYITGTGIYGFNGIGQRTFFIDSTNGNAYFSGSVFATSGSIGGWQINSGSLIANGASMSGTGGLAFGSPAKFIVDINGNLTATSASISGAITASSGNIGGWSISSTELFSGSVHINSQAPAIYIGRGVHGDAQTPFYVDGASRFSLGNSFIYYPAYGNGVYLVTTGNTASISPTGASIAVYDPIAASIQPTMLITGSAFAVGTQVASVTHVSSSVAVVLLSASTSSSGSVNANFQMDSYSELIVRGKISGIVETTTNLSSAVLSNYVTSASVGPTPDKIYFTTASGHAWAVNTTIIFQGLPSSTPLFSNMEYAITHNSFQIVAVPNSSVFVVSVGAASVNFTANTNYVMGSGSGVGTDIYLDPYTDLYGGTSSGAAIASMQELTLGSYPTEIASARTGGAGLRLDPYNYWLVNNQMRIGNDQTSMFWDGSQLGLKNNLGSSNVALNIGGTKSYIAMYTTSASPGWTLPNTSFWVDSTGYLSVGGSALIWDPTAGLTVNGTINAANGLIGGFIITASSLSGFTTNPSQTSLNLIPSKSQIKFNNPQSSLAPFGSIRVNTALNQYASDAELKVDLLSNISAVIGTDVYGNPVSANNGGANYYAYFNEYARWSRLKITNAYTDASEGTDGITGPFGGLYTRLDMESYGVGQDPISGSFIPADGKINLAILSADLNTTLTQLALDGNGATLQGGALILAGNAIQIASNNPYELDAATSVENISGISTENVTGIKKINAADILLNGTQVTTGPGGTVGTPASQGSFAVSNVPTTNNTYPAYFYYAQAGGDNRYYYFMSRSTSSSATKDFISEYSVDSADFMNLRPVVYSMKGDESKTPKSGFYAEEVAELDSLKHYVTYNPENAGEPEGLDYAPMVTMLTSMVQQQQRTIEELSASVSALQNAIIGLGEK